MNQFGEDFGLRLEDSPFCRSIRCTARGTVLVVDRNADSLTRIWCGLELYYTNKLNKSLQLYTSMGQVGVDVFSGPLVQAVEEWDVCRMEASQAVLSYPYPHSNTKYK